MHALLKTLLMSVLLASPLLFTACNAAGPEANKGEACVDCIEGTGTIRHSSVEGGFWYIESDDGEKYDPYGIPEEFATEGLRVKFTVRPQPERMGFHMLGTIVELVDIEAIGQAGNDKTH